MSDIERLISSLQHRLEQTQSALDSLYERRAELEKRPDTPSEEINRNNAEILTLENMVEQTELAISSLSGRKQTGGFDEFGLGFGLK